jgi:ribosome-binding factor A
VSKRIRDRDRASGLLEQEFATALEEEDSERRQARGRHMEHKTSQLCRQVQRALNLALAREIFSGTAGSLFVSDVSPAPGCGHLLVHVVIPNGWSTKEVLTELRARTPGLRAEVARSISRKRAPELSFVAGAAEEYRHE